MRLRLETGRTHQVRVHLTSAGHSLLGDPVYGVPSSKNSKWLALPVGVRTKVQALPGQALHAQSLVFKHPATGQEAVFSAPPDFDAETRLALRTAFIDPAQTNACRLIHGASDGWPGWYVDRLGDHFLSQSEQPLTSSQRAYLDYLVETTRARMTFLGENLSPTSQIGRAHV